MRGRGAYIKGHPGDWLIMGDFSPLDEAEGEGFIVEFYSEDGPRWGPRPNHQMVKHCGV